MVSPAQASGGHSARVNLELRIGEARYPLSQISADRLILSESAVLPGVSGEVVAVIDDHPRRWNVTWEPSEQPRKIVPAEFRDPA